MVLITVRKITLLKLQKKKKKKDKKIILLFMSLGLISQDISLSPLELQEYWSGLDLEA